MQEDFSEELKKLVESRIKALQIDRGAWSAAWWKIRQIFFAGPRAEIAHDWEVVSQFAERAKQRFAENGKPSQADKCNLAEVIALLECARTEIDFGQAWTYVNSADALLPLVVAPDELHTAIVRLRTADERLPTEYQHRLKVALAQIDKDNAQEKHATEQIHLHRQQLARTLLWNSVNRGVSLKLSLWRSISGLLIVAFAAFFVALAVLANYPPKAFEEAFNAAHSGARMTFLPVTAPFLEITLLGFFGGMLSAFLTAREAEVNVPSYEVQRTRVILRMLLGGAGALVVYTIGLWLFSDKLTNAIESKIYVFVSVGIVAGFSERLLISTLDRAGQNLRLTGSPSQSEEHHRAAAKRSARKGRRSVNQKPGS